LGQPLQRQLAHFARTDEHDRRAAQPAENFLRQLNGHGTDGGPALPERRLRPHGLGGIEGVLEQAVQGLACRSVQAGALVGMLDLVQDLGFAKHH
jgi:hypothetical protein